MELRSLVVVGPQGPMAPRPTIEVARVLRPDSPPRPFGPARVAGYEVLPPVRAGLVDRYA